MKRVNLQLPSKVSAFKPGHSGGSRFAVLEDRDSGSNIPSHCTPQLLRHADDVSMVEQKEKEKMEQ